MTKSSMGGPDESLRSGSQGFKGKLTDSPVVTHSKRDFFRPQTTLFAPEV
ncbi:hypothetical protein BSY240_4525 (plasmid) [Agrobacterium sp. RAC06]|nr:hypothetical protein BSY240_4525 [Agrobacterium sp. RAC06]